jgi:hypothetical protein
VVWTIAPTDNELTYRVRKAGVPGDDLGLTPCKATVRKVRLNLNTSICGALLQANVYGANDAGGSFDSIL